MNLFLTVLSGLAWTVVYAEAIRIGFRDKTYAMPAIALGLNFAWESIYAVHDLLTRVSAQAVVNLIWAIADVFIVITFFRFGRRELPKGLPRSMFIAGGLLLFAASYAAQGLFFVHFGAHWGARYSAFLQNVLMSALFIAMLVSRHGLRGQTLTIAVAKWLGTFAPTILVGVIGGSAFVTGLGAICFVLDVVYIALVLWVQRNPGVLAGPLA